MPKIVDPEQRRLAVAEAVFRVIRRDGVEQTSLRAVAAEAGLAIGSVRHYFTSHEELIVFAMRTLARRVTARIEPRAAELLAGDPADSLDAVTELLGELLPLDDERAAEAEVWLAFTAAARTRPALATEAARVHDGTRALVRHSHTAAASRGALRDGLDLDVEVERTAALIDGLTLGGVSRPGSLTPRLARQVLRTHLASLRRDQPPSS